MAANAGKSSEGTTRGGYVTFLLRIYLDDLGMPLRALIQNVRTGEEAPLDLTRVARVVSAGLRDPVNGRAESAE